jgi:hypothetical protein
MGNQSAKCGKWEILTNRENETSVTFPSGKNQNA